MYSDQLILEIDAAAAARQARALPTQVWRVLRLFDGHRTLLQAIDDSPLDRSTTLAVVERLTELGLVQEAARAARTCRVRGRLSARTRAWIATRRRTQQAPETGACSAFGDEGLEAALDEVLAELDAQDASASELPELGAIPEAREHPLSDALQLTIQAPDWPAAELLETLALSEKVRRRLEQVHEICDVPHGPMMLLDAPEAGFTNQELEFFDSYVPELPDDDDFMDLVMEAAGHGD
jgi:hypothetical protein